MEIKAEITKPRKQIQQKAASAEDFAQFVKDIVKAEVKEVLKSLVIEEGIQVGKKHIEKSRNKIIKKIMDGDKGRLQTDPSTVEKIKVFVKRYLIHQ
eukprot:CAMPEP_0202942368 /NCGR_PEP_ID=MMETSP1395-20130829/2550_1 /ASSEMBLY_ACC=CAM_ASM_000871 /TAXON_ID=5961 /ORGANISM="Blepharisma japonicum, Strain Stock R1072" /LENGTH=96 /DNA_ID=CAMNT_0049638535 /DNA_START=182 /DNA_END=469 /DNA_ORIENTATION=+